MIDLGLLEEVVRQRIDEKAADTHACLVLPGAEHLARVFQIAVRLPIKLIDRGNLRTWLGDLPASAVVAISVYVVTILIEEYGQYFDAVTLKVNSHDLAVGPDI